MMAMRRDASGWLLALQVMLVVDVEAVGEHSECAEQGPAGREARESAPFALQQGVGYCY